METRQHVIDDDQLRLASIGHYLVASLHFAFCWIFVLHAFMLGAAVFDPTLLPEAARESALPAPLARFMFAAVIAFIGFGWIFCVLTFYAGRCIARRRRRRLVTAMAVAQLFAVPLGTALGAFTLGLLRRPSVRREFDEWDDAARSLAENGDAAR